MRRPLVMVSHSRAAAAVVAAGRDSEQWEVGTDWETAAVAVDPNSCLGRWDLAVPCPLRGTW